MGWEMYGLVWGPTRHIGFSGDLHNVEARVYRHFRAEIVELQWGDGESGGAVDWRKSHNYSVESGKSSKAVRHSERSVVYAGITSVGLERRLERHKRSVGLTGLAWSAGGEPEVLRLGEIPDGEEERARGFEAGLVAGLFDDLGADRMLNWVVYDKLANGMVGGDLFEGGWLEGRESEAAAVVIDAAERLDREAAEVMVEKERQQVAGEVRCLVKGCEVGLLVPYPDKRGTWVCSRRMAEVEAKAWTEHAGKEVV